MLFIGGCISFLSFGLFSFIYESPRYLASNKHDYKESKAVLAKIGIINKKPLPHVLLHGESANQDVHETIAKNTYFDLCRYKSIRMPFIVCAVVWLSITISYYGMVFLLEENFGNIYVKGFIMEFAEVAANLAAAYALNRLGRKNTCIGCFAVSSVGSIIVSIIMLSKSHGSEETLIESLGIFVIGIVRFAITSAYLLIYVYTAELFPTHVRSIAFGGCNIVARFATFLAPNLINIGKYLNIEPLLLLACLQIIAGLLSTRLEETLGKELRESIQEESDNREVNIINNDIGTEPNPNSVKFEKLNELE